jgi:hypothetical protein
VLVAGASIAGPALAHWLRRLHVRSLGVSRPDAEPSPEPGMAALTALVERAINGVELPGYAGVPDSGAVALR